MWDKPTRSVDNVMQADIGYRRYQLKIVNRAVPATNKNQRFLTQRNQRFLLRGSTVNAAVSSGYGLQATATFRPLGMWVQISTLLYYDIYCISEVNNVPSISIYVNDKLYKYLLNKGPSPSVAGKDIIEADYNKNSEAGGK